MVSEVRPRHSPRVIGETKGRARLAPGLRGDDGEGGGPDLWPLMTSGTGDARAPARALRPTERRSASARRHEISPGIPNVTLSDRAREPGRGDGSGTRGWESRVMG